MMAGRRRELKDVLPIIRLRGERVSVKHYKEKVILYFSFMNTQLSEQAEKWLLVINTFMF